MQRGWELIDAYDVPSVPQLCYEEWACDNILIRIWGDGQTRASRRHFCPGGDPYLVDGAKVAEFVLLTMSASSGQVFASDQPVPVAAFPN